MERKIEEAVLSLMLEDNYSKDEILELYLNTTYFGAGSTGIKQASRTYFGKAPSGADFGRGRRNCFASLRAHQPQSAGKPRGLQKTSAAGAGRYA